MKRVLSVLALLVLMASQVLASDLDLDPEFTTMSPSDVKTVDACITEEGPSGEVPLVGIALEVSVWCKNLNGNSVCDAGDILFPLSFAAVVTETPTDATGCGEVTLITGPTADGEYRYKVNGKEAGVVVASETGIVLVPEFTTIGAGLVLAGAGFYIYRKRSKK